MEIEPVGITLTGTSTSRLPRRMIEPLPYCFSICEIAKSRFLVFSSFIVPPREGFRLGPAAAGGPILPECRHLPAAGSFPEQEYSIRRTKSESTISRLGHLPCSFTHQYL